MKPDARTLLCVTLAVALNAHAEATPQALSEAAIARTQHVVKYDGSYRSIAYPNGDVPAGTGVCTDVVIRSYRALGIDLQQQVHEDMRAHFSRYPSKRLWGLTRTDTNIDHRRVPNLQVFFSRHGQALPRSRNAADYAAGDIVRGALELRGDFESGSVVAAAGVLGPLAIAALNFDSATGTRDILDRLATEFQRHACVNR